MRSGLGNLLIMLCILLSGPVRGEVPGYVFGVLNQQSPQQTAARWLPILRYVGEKAGVDLALRMGPTVAATDSMMGRGEFDFMFTNHNFQKEYDGVGYQVIARWGDEPIRCAFVVLPDSLIRTLGDLHGKPVSYPNPDAFVAYAVPKTILKQLGVVTEDRFAGNQDAALSQLRFRQTAAAAVNSRFLKQFEAQSGIRFRVIHESEAYPDLAIIVHPRVPAPVRERVRAALLGMARDPAAAAILAQSKTPGFEAATDQDYASVRKVYQTLAP